MRYNYEIMLNVINTNAMEPEDLVKLLEISIEDIVDRFPERLKDNWYKFVGDAEGDDEQIYDEEIDYSDDKEI